MTEQDEVSILGVENTEIGNNMNKLEAAGNNSHAVNLVGLVTHQIEDEIN